MQIKKYIKKPVPIEAVLLTTENVLFVYGWIKENGGKVSVRPNGLIIETLEGYMFAKYGECYIAKGIDGEFYPIRADIFERTYKEAEYANK